MVFSLEIVKEKVVAALNLSVRDTSGIPVYSSALGDSLYATEEIDRACQTAATLIMAAICETDGNTDRSNFQTTQTLTHAGVLPTNIGSIGVPRITPYAGATYKVMGKRKSMDEIMAYRANPNRMYSPHAHDSKGVGGVPSKLSGYYSVDETGQFFYFTGHAAEAELTNFSEADYPLLPDRYYPVAVDLAIADLRKDGDTSDVFSAHEQRGLAALAQIRGDGEMQPSGKLTVGNRDNASR